ncbi:hypothetical protein KJ567_00050, partial [Candidatus Bipolaricaulota bacterium]|nr:hypothetical protein [Candidatus Bipolaricaulota bacterium]
RTGNRLNLPSYTWRHVQSKLPGAGTRAERARVISSGEARGGLYIDFEGARDAPSLLAVLFFDEEEDDVVYAQYILEADLHPAAPLDVALMPSSIHQVAEILFDQSVEEDRRIFAWSSYEERVLAGLLGDDDALVKNEIVDARGIADSWMARTDPQHASRSLPKGKRNALSVYLDLIDYERWPDAIGHQPVVGIDLMRAELRRAGGELAGVSVEARDAWRKTLHRNFDDCDGMREVLLHITRQGA